MNFQDHFSADSDRYREFRPHYPDELFTHLESLCPDRDVAWDCATGSGQAAANLASRFDRVYATDASAAQIADAERVNGVHYAIARAEDCGLEDQSVDLITVAQALHWFDIPAFAGEVRRVAKTDAILAAWTYNLLSVDAALNKLIERLYRDVLGQYWPVERRLVETGYADVQLPFPELDSIDFEVSASWSFTDLIGYLKTWSAVRLYEKQNAANPVDELHAEFRQAWGDPDDRKIIRWPLKVKIWEVR